ncbi:MAG TPA: hypothetical protein VNY36_03345 [Bacteroidia bacterium]|jgi:hypothetical protein|nr:hypothetical protein [Bacteroidia bacterium]
MLIKEFNEMPLDKKSKLVFAEGKLIGVIQDHELQKAFYYKLNDLKVDVVYDKVNDKVMGVNAWENAGDRSVLKTVI